MYTEYLAHCFTRTLPVEIHHNILQDLFIMNISSYMYAIKYESMGNNFEAHC